MTSSRFCFTRLSFCSALAALSIFAVTSGHAAPEGGQITGGIGNISQSGTETTIDQDSHRLSVEWDSFNISQDERVQFVQPDRESIALNRILSHDASQIFGRIDANGRVILANPNGMIFGESSQVNVGGLIASGLDIESEDFMNGELSFRGAGSDGMVVNRGIINAALGGNVVLQGSQASNEGLISADLGSVSLAAGSATVLTFDPEGLLGVRITEETARELGIEPAVNNSGDIVAPRSRVLLSASVSEEVFSRAVYHDQPVEPPRVRIHDDGSFTLGKGSDVVNTGTIDISHKSGNPNYDGVGRYSGMTVMLGENVRHSGQIRTYSANPGIRAEVVLAAANKVLVDGGAITEISLEESGAPWPGSGAKLSFLGREVILTGDSRIVTASDEYPWGHSQVWIGGEGLGTNSRLAGTDNVIIGPGVEIYAEPGYISIWSGNEATVEGGLYTGDSGDLTVEAKHALTFDADTYMRHGYGGSDGFELQNAAYATFRSKSLTISEEARPGTISQESLNKIGEYARVVFEAEHRIGVEGKEPVTVLLGEDASFTATGTEQAPGIIDLEGLTIESLPYPIEEYNTDIVFEADQIHAPGFGVEGATSDRKALWISMTAHDGDIVHTSKVHPYRGGYTAQAKGSIRFESGAAVVSTAARPGFAVDIKAGEDIDINLEAAHPISENDHFPMALTGRDIAISANDVPIESEIQAKNLGLTSSSGITLQADVDGRTHIQGLGGATGESAGETWSLSGNYRLLSMNTAPGTNVAISDEASLKLGNLSLDESRVSIDLPDDGAVLSQAPHSNIELKNGTQLSLTAPNIELGGQGAATVVATGGDENPNNLNGSFSDTLSLSGKFDLTDEASEFNFVGSDEANTVAINKKAVFHTNPDNHGSVNLGDGQDTLRLAAQAPMTFTLGEGADTIEYLAPHLSFSLQDFNEDEDVVIPYVPSFDKHYRPFGRYWWMWGWWDKRYSAPWFLYPIPHHRGISHSAIWRR